MSFQLTTTDIHRLTTPDEVRQRAQRVASFGGTDSERDERASRKAHIKAKILGGEMTPFRWCIGTVPSLNLTRRVNGQHSSEVFLELAEEEWPQVQFPVIVIWEEYTCETKVDLALLFEQFDPTWSSRNKHDLVGAHLGVHDDLLHTVSRHVATHATGGVQWYREKAEGYTSTAESQFTLIHENHDIHAFLVWCGHTLSKEKTPELMHPRATLAAIYHCMRDPDPAVRDFWKAVAAGKAHNDEDTPAYKLAVFLELTRTCKVASDWPKAIQRHLKLNKQRPSDKDIFATCLRACSGAVKGQKVGEVFTPAKRLTVPQLLADLYPLPLPQAA